MTPERKAELRAHFEYEHPVSECLDALDEAEERIAVLEAALQDLSVRGPQSLRKVAREALEKKP